MDREYVVWGLVCWSCIKDMTDDQIIDICERHSDAFEIQEGKVKLTKTFIHETTSVDSLSGVWGRDISLQRECGEE